MDYEKLKEVIAKQIKENGRREITGPVLQAVLMAMVDSLGEVYPQTYTDEEKAQARANIDALSDHNGEITKEKLSAEVQAILDDVANKQNITDESLATIAKTIVGAINELFNGGVKDKSIEIGKLAQAVQDTLKMVGTNVKILPKGTDLLSDNIEEGVHILLPTGSGTYPNFPYSMNLHPSATAILAKAGDISIILGIDMSSSDELPLLLQRRNGGNWYGTSITNKFYNKLDNTSTLTDTEINNIWDNN